MQQKTQIHGDSAPVTGGGKKHLWPVLSGSKSPDLKTICLDMTDDSHTDADIASGQRLSCGI